LFHPADSPVSQGLAPILQRLIKGSSGRKEWSLSEQMQVRLDFFTLLNALANGLVSQISDHSAQLAQRIAEKIELLVSGRFDGNWVDDSAAGKGIQQIAEELEISISHCYKIFKSVYQMSPRQYVSQKILDEARRLLRDPHLSIEEIAYRMKYHDPAHFSRQFKRWTGLYPGEYRLVIRSR
jgi:AraC-like DNA-binding protein